MPGYVTKMLHKLQYSPRSNPQYSPHEYTAIKFSKKGDIQYSHSADTSPFLDKEETRWVQSAVGSLLYYARALDNTILPALNTIGTTQATPTHNTKLKLHRLLDYVNTYNRAYIRMYASDMILNIDSDAAYLVLPNARSRIAGYFRLLDKSPDSPYSHNGAILIECKTLRSFSSGGNDVAQSLSLIHI